MMDDFAMGRCRLVMALAKFHPEGLHVCPSYGLPIPHQSVRRRGGARGELQSNYMEGTAGGEDG